MKFRLEDVSSVCKNLENTLIISGGIIHLSKKRELRLKQIAIHFLFMTLVILSWSFTLKAQEIRKTSSSSTNSSVIVLRIKGLADEKLCANVESILNDYHGKILSHAVDKQNNNVSVVISDKLQVTDLLEILEMNGIHAGYMNEKNEYVTLDEDGDLAEPINITK